ncbi:MAG TPA: hypothetical protein DC046_08760 [Rhodospirillaceae bacterium]|nr:hypothetical protein [Rhodospirillaceae bacterium]
MNDPMNEQKREGVAQFMARWCIDGWKGKIPLTRMFWGGGAVWFIGFALERGVVNLFRVPQSPYFAGELYVLDGLLRLCEWILMASFVWWCIGVWRAVDHETPGIWPTTARGMVALLVIANMASAFVALSR